ncbi:putative integral membrane cytochrome D ubiquinol oxidase (Subunit I) CydA [Microlunatus endophyticus]|uniref:Integral membrane cytochrome D ubiquinol oxidase (Subunit I) CydA n=1 Tax=Microlunatus endophyticus TaxID=1716077 RepID=A0A917SEP0_9ACTN|nr:cytochrome ubiquinol oxidase subunit I [Microlunatus endophyticus]GGL71941.1 putative integral membrane cytochrome D ubiquinol oxidase (Subunit I) CydA [Microlunatus endophyticus]
MDTELLSRFQFGITTVYHFFFVPTSIGLSGLVAGFQTAWVRTGKDRYLRLTRLYGKLFLINFAVGVVTGIVQEFQFGMNWSQFSRFVGDIFGAPLALEGLLAFFLESTFLGLWIFGWDKLPRKVHLACIWIVAVATVLSAWWILAANSWMQHPVGYTINHQLNRAELTNFGAVLTNPVLLATMPHQIFACYMVGAAIVIAVAAWHLVRIARADRAAEAALVSASDPASDYVRDSAVSEDRSTFRTALRVGAVALLISGAGTFISGDTQGKVMTSVQPMKMAAAEALYYTEQPAAFSIFTIGSLDGKSEVWSIRIPGLLSFLAHGNFHDEVLGINNLQAKYNQQFGPGDYAPIIPVTYWSFRIMMGLGIVAFVGGALILWLTRKGRDPSTRGFWGVVWRFAPILLPFLPLFGNSFGWIFTEMGRQPWLVFGLLPTASGVSTNLTPAEVWISLSVFTLVYGVMAVVGLRLFIHTVKDGLPDLNAEPEPDTGDKPLSYAF